MQASSPLQQRLFEAATSLGVTPVPYERGHELLEEHETDTERELVTTLLDISDITFKDSGRGLRSVHAKSHGLLRGEFQVLDLPLPYAQGLFATPQTYPALIRLSTTPGDLLDDKVSTPRGFALKVIGVQGERLPGSPGAVTQDFLLVNGPAFLALLRGTEKIIEAVGGESGTLKGLGGHPETHILGETFFSQVPFLYGLHMAKWQIAPVSPELLALKDAPVDLSGTPDGLRAAVVEHFATRGGEWELRVQLCTSLERMPIEDATAVWPEEESPFVPVARLTVRPQSAWNETRSVEMDDGLSFSPWHGLAAYRPLIARALPGARARGG